MLSENGDVIKIDRTGRRTVCFENGTKQLRFRVDRALSSLLAHQIAG